MTGADYDNTAGASLGLVTFDYDLLGNRNTVWDALNGVTHGYAHNLANEYNKVTTGTVLPGSANYFYDVRGNLSRDDGFDTNDNDFFVYDYDPENRLTQVRYDYDGDGGGLTAVAAYKYDSQGRRIEFIDSIRNVTLRYYHDGANMIAEYDQSGTLSRSYIHGSQYIDERVALRDHTQDPVAGDGRTGEDHYYLLKDLYTAAGLVGRNGSLEEAYVYDAYGRVSLWEYPAEDINRDGVVDTLDLSMTKGLLFQYGKPTADVNANGMIDILELGLVKAALFHYCAQVNYSSVDNPYFFTGRLTDALHAEDLLTSNDAEVHYLQDNRNRMYDPQHGRWLQRDPVAMGDILTHNHQGVHRITVAASVHKPVRISIPSKAPISNFVPSDPAVQPLIHKAVLNNQYADGMNLYVYVRSKPHVYVDPLGLNAGIKGGDAHVGIVVDVQDEGCYGILEADFRYEGYEGALAQKFESINGPGEVQISYMPKKKIGAGFAVARLVKGSIDQDERLLQHIAGTAGILPLYIHIRNRKQSSFSRTYSGKGEWDTYSWAGHSCVAYTDTALDVYLGKDWYVPKLETHYNWPDPEARQYWNPPPLLYPSDLIKAWDKYGAN